MNVLPIYIILIFKNIIAFVLIFFCFDLWLWWIAEVHELVLNLNIYFNIYLRLSFRLSSKAFNIKLLVFERISFHWPIPLSAMLWCFGDPIFWRPVCKYSLMSLFKISISLLFFLQLILLTFHRFVSGCPEMLYSERILGLAFDFCVKVIIYLLSVQIFHVEFILDAGLFWWIKQINFLVPL